MNSMEAKYRIKPLMSTMTACKRMRYNDPKTVEWICKSALEVFDEVPQAQDEKFWTNVLWTFCHYPHYDLWRTVLDRLDFNKLTAFNNNLLALHSLMLVEHHDHALCRKLLTNMLKAKNNASGREDFKGK